MMEQRLLYFKVTLAIAVLFAILAVFVIDRARLYQS
jgi:hypothetical protein